jgi:hypothetical protein
VWEEKVDGNELSNKGEQCPCGRMDHLNEYKHSVERVKEHNKTREREREREKRERATVAMWRPNDVKATTTDLNKSKRMKKMMIAKAG